MAEAMIASAFTRERRRQQAALLLFAEFAYAKQLLLYTYFVEK
jgi:hypothetical protein